MSEGDTLCKVQGGCDLFIPIGAGLSGGGYFNIPGVGLPSQGNTAPGRPPPRGRPGGGGPSTTFKPPRPATAPFVPSPRPSPVTVPAPLPGPLPPGPLEPALTPELGGAGAGEPPFIEIPPEVPEYPEPRPNIGERIFFPIPAPSWLARVFSFVTGPWSPLGDLGNLLLYSQELGPSAQQEANNVLNQLIPAINPTLQQFKPVDFEGLPDFGLTGPSTMLDELTVTGLRPARATDPVVDPLLSPGLVPEFGLSPRTFLDTAAAPGVAPGLGLDLSPLGALDPRNAIRSRTGSGTGFSRALSPIPEPTPLTDPLPDLSGAQCQCTDTKPNKNKKKRKSRDVCYRGVYEDRKNGLVKLRRERITCR